MDSSRSRPRSLVILGGLAFAIGLSGCRPDPTISKDNLEHYYVDIFRPFFTRKISASGEAAYETAVPLKRRRETFLERKAPGTLRVFLVGGSVAQLYQTAGDDAPLKSALESLLPGKRLEIINCGSSGYDSPRESLIIKEILHYHPDLVILMSGLNENAVFFPPEWIGRPAAKLWRLPLISTVYWRFLQSPQIKMLWGTPPSFDDNISKILRAVKAKGVPVVLCTMPVNLRDMPPKGVLPLHTPVFFEAWGEYERGHWAKAAAAFARYAQQSPQDPFGAFFLARSLDRQGLPARAKPHYIRAWNLTGPPVPANEALRRLAREQGAVLADLEKAFMSAAPDGIPGRVQFEDDVHWERPLDKLATATIARALFDAAQAAPTLLAPARQWDESWLRSHEGPALVAARELRLTKEKSWLVFRYRLWVPLGKSALFSERVLALIETLYLAHPDLLANSAFLKPWLQKQLTGNIWGNEAVDGLDIWWPSMMGHVGEFYRRLGRQALAVAYFTEALRLKPKYDKIRLHKALAQAQLGQSEEAWAEIKRIPNWEDDPEIGLWIKSGRLPVAVAGQTPAGARLAEAIPSNPAGVRRLIEESAILDEPLPLKGVALWIQRAELAQKKGDIASALSALAEAQRLNPQGEHLRSVALLFQGLRRYDEALSILEVLARREPANAALWHDKGVCQYLNGQTKAAVETLRKAIQLDPELLPAYLSLGSVYNQMGDSHRAIEIYEQGLSRKAKTDSPVMKMLKEAKTAAAAWPGSLKEAEAAFKKGAYTKANKLFRPAADRGEPQAQYRLGEMYNLGHGLPRDYAEAVKWYLKAADQDHTRAEVSLGALYYNGQGVPRDFAAALRFFVKAAQRGDAAAQFSTGNMFYNGDGVPKDFKKAARWYLMAAEQGHAKAQNNLGVMYSQGQGVPKDQDKAELWFRKAKVERSE